MSWRTTWWVCLRFFDVRLYGIASSLHAQAVVTLGATPASLGVIQSATAYTARLFGHLPAQLERQNVAVLLPPIFSDGHDGFLRSYLETGSGRVVDYTRVVLGLHKAGHIFPMLLAVREAVVADGSIAFVGVMRALATSEQHILLDANHGIAACSLESFRLLGLTPAALTGSIAEARPRISEWVAEWDAVQAALTSEAGTTVLVTEPVNAVASVSASPRDDSASLGDCDEGSSPHASLAPNPTSSKGVWVHAQLQRLALPSGLSVSVLHWRRMQESDYIVSEKRKSMRLILSQATHHSQRAPLPSVVASAGPASCIVEQEPSPDLFADLGAPASIDGH